MPPDANLATNLRARADEIHSQDIPQAHAVAARAAKLSRELVSTATPALLQALGTGLIAKDFAAAVAKAAADPKPAPELSPEARGVFVLLRQQLDRDARWLAGEATEVTLEVARLEGEARGLRSAAAQFEAALPPPVHAAPAEAPSGPVVGSAAQAWTEMRPGLFWRRNYGAVDVSPTPVDGPALSLSPNDLAVLLAVFASPNPVVVDEPPSVPPAAPAEPPAPADGPSPPPAPQASPTGAEVAP